MTPGQKLTYDAEGTDLQCKYPHVPGWWIYRSGITLWRGYDCRDKKPTKIIADLLKAGIEQSIAYEFAQAAGLKGKVAHDWLLNSGLDEYEMTPKQGIALFQISYSEIEASAKRIYSKQGCRDAYGWIIIWEELNSKIRDVIIDLRFRGDWTPSTRKHLALPIRSNYLPSFAEAMGKKVYWMGLRRVPRDRFHRRVNFLKGE